MEFHKKVKGSMAEDEDWWNLLIKDEEQVVIHGWSYLNRGTLKTESGTKTYTVDEFMESDSSVQAKNKLAEYLRSNSK